MKIELQKIKIRDLFDGYVDNAEEGVFAFHGKLNVRPPYQREFCYDDKKRRRQNQWEDYLRENNDTKEKI